MWFTRAEARVAQADRFAGRPITRGRRREDVDGPRQRDIALKGAAAVVQTGRSPTPQMVDLDRVGDHRAKYTYGCRRAVVGARLHGMAQPAPTMYSFNGRPDRLSWQAAGGFLIILLIALLPLQGVALWIDINEFNRWAYTSPLFALAVLSTAGVMVRKRATPVIPLYLIMAAALGVIISSGYGLWNDLHYLPGEDDYLSAGLVLSGYLLVGVLAAVGVVGSLLDRRRRS